MASKFLHLEEAFLPRDRRRNAMDGDEKQSDLNHEPVQAGPHLAVYKIESLTPSIGTPMIRVGRRRQKRSIS